MMVGKSPVNIMTALVVARRFSMDLREVTDCMDTVYRTLIASRRPGMTSILMRWCGKRMASTVQALVVPGANGPSVVTTSTR